MMQIMQALGVGVSFGMLITWLNLPLPAPNNAAGIAGVIGAFIGYIIMK